MTTANHITESALLRYYLTYEKAVPIMQNVLTDAIKLYDRLDWTENCYARQDDGEPFDFSYNNLDNVDAICSVCALGAIKLSVWANPKKYKTTSLRHRAEDLTVSYLRDILGRRAYIDPVISEPPTVHGWNDDLHEAHQLAHDDAKAKVVELFNEALDLLKKEIA